MNTTLPLIDRVRDHDIICPPLYFSDMEKALYSIIEYKTPCE